MNTPEYPCKLGLAIIAKYETTELDAILSKYISYFDEVHIAHDSEFTNLSDKVKVYKYEWQSDFAHKRNFLHNKCIEAGLDYYFTIDTDDEICGAEHIREIAGRAKELNIDIVYCPYIYSHDENGAIDAQHNKERFVKCTPKLVWTKPIHENILPVSGYTQKIVIDNRVIVNHLASAAKLQISHDRNMTYLLDEFKRDGENTDPRTLAYLGRCYMSQQEFGKAIYFLERHIEKSGWNEDRYVSFCQLSNIFNILKQYDKAKACAFEALEIMPTYPDAYICLHETYLSLGNYKKSIYWGEESIRHKHPDTFIMIDPSKFTWRLAMSLSYAYMMNDEVDKAYRFFQRAKSIAPNVDYIKNNAKWYEEAYTQSQFIDKYVWLLNYIEKESPDNVASFIQSIPETLKDNEIIARIKARYLPPRKWSDKSIVIMCGDAFEPWSPKSIKSGGIGGSEEAVIYLSEELVRQGWEVTVYNNCADDAGTYNGVTYANLHNINPRDYYNILISWRSNVFASGVASAKLKIVWLHDIIAGDILNDWKQIDRIFVLSEYHKSLVPKEIPEYKIIVTSNGVNIDTSTLGISTATRDPYRMIYASSYDRGLEYLLTNWHTIKSAVPRATLHVFYGWQNIEKLIREERMTNVWYDKMNELLKQPGIVHHGRVDHDTLHAEYLKSRIWVYPCAFPEVSCITAMKAQVLGCIPVTTDNAALKETVKSGVIIPGNMSDPSVTEKFISSLIATLKSDMTAETCTYDFSWRRVALQWTDIFNTFTKKLRVYGGYDDYKQYYLEHAPEIPDLTMLDDNRVYRRMSLSLEWMKKAGATNHLDIGTFDGTFPILVARELKINTTGIDANINHIASGQRYVEQYKLNVKLKGGILAEEYSNGQQYDFITAHEILEHVIDTNKFLTKISTLVSDTGHVSISTPLDEGTFGKYQFNEEAEHIRTYSEQSLRAELTKHFDVIEIDNDGEILTALCKKKVSVK